MKVPLDELAMLRLPDVIKLVGLCKSSIYQMKKEGRFPQSVSLGPRAVGWPVCVIRAWLQAVSLGGKIA